MTAICITADDFGLRAENDVVIARLAEGGFLDAVSITVHADATLDVVESLPGCVATGLHIVLIGERPLERDALGPMLDRDGRLPVAWPLLFASLARRPSLMAGLRAEIAAQLSRFMALGLPLDFVNSHQHVHLFAPIWHTLRTELARRGLAVPVRVVSGTKPKELAIVAAQLGAFVLAGKPTAAPMVARGLAWSGDADIHRVDATLARIAREGGGRITELVFHPGGAARGAAPRHARWRYDWAREAELIASGGVDRCVRRWALQRVRPSLVS